MLLYHFSGCKLAWNIQVVLWYISVAHISFSVRLVCCRLKQRDALTHLNKVSVAAVEWVSCSACNCSNCCQAMLRVKISNTNVRQHQATSKPTLTWHIDRRLSPFAVTGIFRSSITESNNKFCLTSKSNLPSNAYGKINEALNRPSLVNLLSNPLFYLCFSSTWM